MRVQLQRVANAAGRVDGVVVGSIKDGLLLLVGFGHSDGATDLLPLARKLANLRVFADEQGRFDRSLLDTGGGALVVPQFTLYASTQKGRRPDFSAAMASAAGAELFDQFVKAMRNTGVQHVETGRFGADMQVELVNDGPVTLLVSNDP